MKHKRPVFIVEFFLDDDDMASSGPEGIVRVLRKLADDIETTRPHRRIRDINGNYIGICRVEHREH